MIWSAGSIRELRKGLGWTQSDLARRLGCKFEEVVALEQGKAYPSAEISRELSHMKGFLASSREQTARAPMAEKLMEDYGLTQITSEDIENLRQEE